MGKIIANVVYIKQCDDDDTTAHQLLQSIVAEKHGDRFPWRSIAQPFLDGSGDGRRWRIDAVAI